MSGVYHYEDKNRRPSGMYQVLNKSDCYNCGVPCLCRESAGMEERTCFDQMMHSQFVNPGSKGQCAEAKKCVKRTLPPSRSTVPGWK